MVRRRIVFGAAVVLVILIVLLINGCLKSEKQQSLKDYNHHVSEIGREFEQQVSKPFFTALSGASGKTAIDVQTQVNQLRLEAEKLYNTAHGLSTPGEMTAAQRAMLMAAGMRVEGLTKIAALLPTALGGQGGEAMSKIAGDMEVFLASDVIWSQRVAPLIQEALKSGGVHEGDPGEPLPAEPRLARNEHRHLAPDRPRQHQLVLVGDAGHARQLAHRRGRRHDHARSRNRRSTTSPAARARPSRRRSKTRAATRRRT